MAVRVGRLFRSALSGEASIAAFAPMIPEGHERSARRNVVGVTGMVVLGWDIVASTREWRSSVNTVDADKRNDAANYRNDLETHEPMASTTHRTRR
jgi:hypothetical protein